MMDDNDDKRGCYDTTDELPQLRLHRATEQVAPLSGPEHLVALVGAGAGRSFTVAADAAIGRDPSCAIWIPEPDVSRHHASVTRTASGQLVLSDTGSKNGTRVNGTPITEHVLRIGDMVALGASSVLMFTRHDPLRSQVLHLQKLESMGRLAGGVAHDFNNLLTVVLNNVRLLQAGLEPGDADACIGEIRRAAEQGAELTRQLLDFSALGKPAEDAVQLGELVEEALDLGRRTFRRAVSIVTETAADVQVIGDRMQLYQVVMNLLLNAHDAMPDGGALTVRLLVEQLDEEAARGTPLSPGSHAVLEFEDTGEGMEEETLRHVFEPFFTTKELGQGTGLGLSMSRDIVHNHGGHLTARSAPGAGTTFRVVLPAAEGEAGTDRRRTRAPTSDVAPARGCILLVDDDELVSRSTGRLLRSLGFQVLLAGGGHEGVRLFTENSKRIDLVILDMVMPDMGGWETFQELQRLDPGVKVLIFSGYAEDQNTRATLEAGALGFLNKPATGRALDLAIQKALEHDAGADS